MRSVIRRGFIVAFAALLFAGCETGQEKISEESLGLRKTELYSEKDTIAAKTEYAKEAAGQSKVIQRAFQDAPPMIPHDVSDFLPVTKSNNACTGCHMPEMAQYMDPKPTPIPGSHFMDMRPKHKYDGKTFQKTADVMKNETSVTKMQTLSHARYNCTLCHAPQSKGELAVKNTFQPVYTKENGAFKSSWDEVVLDDLDTIGGKAGTVTKKDIANKESAAGTLEGGH